MLITISDILGQSWKMYTTHWHRLRTYIFLLFLPALVRTALGLFGTYLDEILPGSALVSNIVIVVLFVLGLIFTLWVVIALTQAVHEFTLGSEVQNWKIHFNTTTHLLWPVIWTSILVALIVIGGTLLFIIPGVIFSVWYAFVSQSVIIDNTRGGQALAHSKELVDGRWWDILWRLLVPGLVFVGATIVARGLILWPADYIFGTTISMAIFKTVVYAIIDAFITPLSVTAIVLLYLSAKKTPTIDVHSPPPLHV